MTPCMLIPHEDNKNTMQVYLVTVMTHVIALQAGQSNQGALKTITPVQLITNIVIYFQIDTFVILSFVMSLSSCLYISCNSARVAICECLACYVNHSGSIFKSLNNAFYIID